MIIFHVAFGVISLLFFYQLFVIKKEQKKLEKKEFYLLKKFIDEKIENQEEREKYQKRLIVLEQDIRAIYKELRDANKSNK